jgi:hypothetical protein
LTQRNRRLDRLFLRPPRAVGESPARESKACARWPRIPPILPRSLRQDILCWRACRCCGPPSGRCCGDSVSGRGAPCGMWRTPPGSPCRTCRSLNVAARRSPRSSWPASAGRSGSSFPTCSRRYAWSCSGPTRPWRRHGATVRR